MEGERARAGRSRTDNSIHYISINLISGCVVYIHPVSLIYRVQGHEPGILTCNIERS